MNRNDGFTTVELLVAIALISIAGAALYAGLSVAVRTLGKADRTVKTAAQVAVIDNALRSHIGRIAIPFWETKYTGEITPETARIAWLDGIGDRSLSIKHADGRLTLTLDEGEESPRVINLSANHVTSITIFRFPDTEGQPAGLRFSIHTERRTFESVYLFTSLPLGKSHDR